MSRRDRVTVRLKPDMTYALYVLSASRRTVAAAICLAFFSGCTSTRETATVPIARPALRPVSLPDMTGAPDSVQTQLRDRYASLTLKIGDSGTSADDLADAYGAMGRFFVAAEYLDAAESCFANAQALVPGDMRWPYYLGHVFRFRNEPAKAAGFFAQSLTLEPAHVPTLVWLGEMRLIQNRPDAAERLFTRGLAIQSRSTVALYGLGRAALARQQYAQAVTHLEAALVLEPQASRLHDPLAMAYRGLGDRRNVDAHLRLRGDVEVSSADPLLESVAGLLKNAAAYEVRGSEALGQREWADAVRNLRIAIELAPQNPGTRVNLGAALYRTGDAAGALEQFETAVRLAPDAEVIKSSPAIWQARFGRAMALVRLQRYREARDGLADAVNIYPDQPDFAHALARVLAAAPDDGVRDARRALTLVQTLLTQQKTMARAETMAMALAESGEYGQAVTWQREAIAEAERTGRTDLVPPMAATLGLYEARRPSRSPWRDDEEDFYPRHIR